jgi:hypothetical protein
MGEVCAELYFMGVTVILDRIIIAMLECASIFGRLFVLDTWSIQRTILFCSVLVCLDAWMV